MLLPQYWNQGYGTEVAEWLMNMGRAYDVLRITAMTHTKNSASVRILEKLGFKKNSIGWMLFETSEGLHDSQIDCYVCEKNTDIPRSEESEHEDGYRKGYRRCAGRPKRRASSEDSALLRPAHPDRT